jgi:hypothetical protein
VIADRRAFTMRNLSLAAFAVIAFEPEALSVGHNILVILGLYWCADWSCGLRPLS